MKRIPLLATMILLATSSRVSAEDIQPGLWRISLESRVAATPDWKPEPFELSQCLSESDAQNPDRLLTGMGAQGVSGCDFPNRQASGNNLKFDVSCGGSLGMKGHGEIHFTATTLDGFLDVSLTAGANEKVEMQNKMHAIYLGPCPSTGGKP
ncbi:MAG: DUF3617 family protein [Methylococcaceae bacterium]|nr:DUF3617 family protein [Methylococcaceae bacterium]